MSAADPDKERGEWVTKPRGTRSPGAPNQLLFNLAMPSSIFNRASSVGPPVPIVIEKLVSVRQRQDEVESCSSSLRLSVLSEERLQAAVRLAKKDLQRKRQQDELSLSPSPLSRETSPTQNHQNMTGSLQKTPSFKEAQNKRSPWRQQQMKSSRSQVLVYTPQKLSVAAGTAPDHGQTPPTRDPGLRSSSTQPQLSREINKLQKELATCIQRVEQLANKERMLEAVEPEEKRRLEIRRQEQTARSARIIYGLQQQVKEIQEDIDKLRSQSTKHTKKSRAVDRLAAAHRGAVRAMQAFITQLSDPAENRVPAQCKELGQLIRQLSLCSAKVEVSQGSNLPETTLDILQKLETLDSALSKRLVRVERSPRLQRSSPTRERSSTARAQSISPPPPPPPPPAPPTRTAKPPPGSRRSAPPNKPLSGRRLGGRPQRAARVLEQERSKVLKAGIQNLVQQREQKQEKRSRTELRITRPASRPVYQDKNKGPVIRDVGFQQPTVSSKLRESQFPQRETSVPWIPTSPHSPTKQSRTVSRRPEPRCLFSPGKTSSPHPTDLQHQDPEQGKSRTQPGVTPGNMQQAHNEALREAWLDRVTEERLKSLNQLSKEEMERINRLRSEVESPALWAERADLAARERLQPLLDSLQGGEIRSRKGSSLRQRLSDQVANEAADNAGVLEDLLDDGVQGVQRERGDVAVAQRLLQEPTLESMLLRMEEMEKDQEEVRRRFAMISYSDPLLWEKEDNRAQRNRDGFRPDPPQPIRLTKPVQRPAATGDILLQRPVETGIISENSVMVEEASDPVPRDPFPNQVRKTGGILLTVPPSVQNNIHKYRKAHDSYLHLVSHEAVGSFDPWAVAESLAEELMEEALEDVAAEFQCVCEDYAEAVFTSEFLQPIHSPPVSVS
ncbi:protein moonraker isoform X3 [Astyanax mexicanus]|uniref:protein moonraker isoform X3 n=1 Tax=Astyanax mexicanus TaxID=7994 RepID=UPI0020CB5BA5|nr:protein moonraker isoform X3 [Astyanax mexicanus]